MPVQQIRVLVPSSAKKRPGGTRAYSYREAQKERAFNRYSSLGAARVEVLDAFLSAINGKGHAARVLRLSGSSLENASTLNHRFACAPTLPALLREGGPLFDALVPEEVREGAAALG